MNVRRPKIIITYGSFDVLHRGHINLLRRARALGDKLYVGLSSDPFNHAKGKLSVFPYRDRKLILENLKFVDRVFKESSWSQKARDIKKYQADTFVIGDDWRGKFDELKKLCRVVYLSRTGGISTTKIKRRIAALHRI